MLPTSDRTHSELQVVDGCCLVPAPTRALGVCQAPVVVEVAVETAAVAAEVSSALEGIAHAAVAKPAQFVLGSKPGPALGQAPWLVVAQLQRLVDWKRSPHGSLLRCNGTQQGRGMGV